MVLSFLKKRSKIIEIVAAHDIVFALAQSGVCAAFSRGRALMNSHLSVYAEPKDCVVILHICYRILQKGAL